MTSKLSWIAFVPFALAALAVKAVQLFLLDDSGMFLGFSSLQLSYIALACVMAIFLFALIFCIIDKKTAPVYLLSRNVFAGCFGLLMAGMLACDGANRAFTMIRTMSTSAIEIVDVVFTVLCAIVFVVMGLNHFVGNGGVRGMALFYLIPAIWGAIRLISCFLQFTTVSIVITDVTILACYIFATLFLFNYAMIVALMKGKSPVKSAFIYGMPAAAVLLSYGVYEVANGLLNTTNFRFFRSIESFELLVLGLYILAFVIEMTLKVRKKSEIKFIEDSEVEEEYEDIADPDSDILDALNSSVSNSNSSDKPVSVNTDLYDKEHLSVDDQLLIDIVQNSMSVSDIDEDETSDFIYGAVPGEDEFILPVNNEENDEIEITDNVEDYITKEDAAYDNEEAAKEEKTESQMDRIDRLILEISEDEKK